MQRQLQILAFALALGTAGCDDEHDPPTASDEIEDRVDNAEDELDDVSDRIDELADEANLEETTENIDDLADESGPVVLRSTRPR